MAQNNNNGFLYFAVGALLIAVLGLGYLYVSDESLGNDVTIVEPASGENNGPDFNLEITDDGFKASADSDNQ